IVLTFTSSEEIKSPEVKIAGREAEIGIGEAMNEWKANLMLTEEDVEGKITVEISYEDLAGNQGTVISETSNGSEVVFDKTPPEPPASIDIESADSSLIVRWEANSETDFALYRLYFGVDEDNLDSYVDIIEKTTDTYTHSDLDNGTTYYYQD